jgi:hypothetical protein
MNGLIITPEMSRCSQGRLSSGSALRVGYDLLLYRAFRHVRPPEELAATSS